MAALALGIWSAGGRSQRLPHTVIRVEHTIDGALIDCAFSAQFAPARVREVVMRTVLARHEPRYGRMVDVVGPGNGSGALAGSKTLSALLLLMRSEFRLAPELGAVGFGDLPAIVSALDDALPLFLGEA